MVISLDISNEEFDGIVGINEDLAPALFMNFPCDIKGVYEFGIVNATINIFDLKEQLINQGMLIDDDSLFVHGEMKVRIEGVKGADFKLIQGDYLNGEKQYFSWPYELHEGDVICLCGGYLPFLNNYFASIIIVTHQTPQITLTFNYDDTIPFDFTSSESIENAQLMKREFAPNASQGKLFDFEFFQHHLGTGRRAIKDR